MPPTREITVSVPCFGADVLFARMDGFDAISACFEYRLHVVSPELDLRAEDALGTGATITVTGEDPRHFHGVVSEFGFEGLRDDYAQYYMVLRPHFWLLSVTTDNRIFQQKSVVDIFDALTRDLPGKAAEKRLQKSYQPRDYCVQYGESDLAFLSRLLEHEGIFWFFEHSEDGHRMVLTDANATLKPAPDVETLPYEPNSRVSFRDGDFITGWQPSTSVRPGKFAHTDYDFEKPSSDLMAQLANRPGHQADSAEHYDYPGNYTLHARGDGLAAIRLQELQSGHVRVRATGTARHLWSGRTFRLELFPREAENDDYLVLRADYRLWDAQYRSGPGEEDAQGYSVALLLGPTRIAFRPERTTPRPVMRGPQTAKVVGPVGAEIFTDKYARVKVQFHWDREGRKDENTTCFIRVSQAWAGAGWGFIQIPRIGQEVIVDFLEGDPDQPIITGRVYNAEQMPPYGVPANATQSGWKSNSSPGGGGWNELRFEDKKGSEEVYFQAEKDHNELVKNDESRKIGHDFAEAVGHDAQQSVGHDRTESVGNDKSTSVGKNRKVNIGVDDTETVGANRSLTVGSNETISVGANSTETIGINHAQTVGAAQAITVGASRVDTVGASETRSVGTAQSNTIGSTRSVSVGKAQTHTIGADDGWTVEGAQTVSVAKDQSVKVGANQSTEVAKDMSYKVGANRGGEVATDDALKVGGSMGVSAGKNILLEAADTITLKCGAAAVALKKDGTITIEGKDITIKGSGKINLKADGEITGKGSKINLN